MSENSNWQIAIPRTRVTAGQLTPQEERQEEHKAALKRNAEIREHYGKEEDVIMDKKYDLGFFYFIVWATPVCVAMWIGIIWGIYKLCH
jgi:hypothetical protein